MSFSTHLSAATRPPKRRRDLVLAALTAVVGPSTFVGLARAIPDQIVSNRLVIWVALRTGAATPRGLQVLPAVLLLAMGLASAVPAQQQVEDDGPTEVERMGPDRDAPSSVDEITVTFG